MGSLSRELWQHATVLVSPALAEPFKPASIWKPQRACHYCSASQAALVHLDLHTDENGWLLHLAGGARQAATLLEGHVGTTSASLAADRSDPRGAHSTTTPATSGQSFHALRGNAANTTSPDTPAAP